jgi:hypothetical protein
LASPRCARNSSGTFTIGLLAIAGVVILAMPIALSLPHEGALQTPSDQ